MSRLSREWVRICFVRTAVPILNSGCSVRRLAKETERTVGRIRYDLKKCGYTRLEDGTYV